MANTTQKHRHIAINTSLGEDKLLFRRMTTTEQLGQLFEFHLELLSEDNEIQLNSMLGTNATVRVELPLEYGTRYFNGYVTQFSHAGIAGRYALYHATMRPWLWFLTRTADCRIFQKKKVPDIIKQVFNDHGFSDFKLRLSGAYREWDYCVQYRETDFDFISRLMQQEGIYYYFTHDNGKHLLVLADDIGSHDTVPNYDKVPYYPPDAQQAPQRDYIYDWSISQQVQPGKIYLNDFDFEVPGKNLRCLLSQPKSHALSGFEMYDYPGEYVESKDGNQYAKMRLEEAHAQYETASGKGSARGLLSGALFSLENYPRGDQDRKYLIVSTHHAMHVNEYVTGQDGEGTTFECSFTVMDSKVPFRSPRVTPKPMIRGPQTAIVSGPKGEEIYTDQYGRVKCQFHWDRYGKADENSSCWIRVSQNWAGKKWGAMFIPRIGQEVIVEHEEGDPDRPIITGRVYNGTNMPPYELPANMTRSSLKSLSSKGGGGFNELRFEDKKGEEQIFIHGERNQDTRIKNDAFEWIGHDRHLIVKNDQFEKVEANKHLIVTADQKEKVSGDKHQAVQGNHNQKVTGTLSIDVAQDIQEKAGANYALQATSGEIHLKAGQKVVIEAGMELTIKAGSNFIKIDMTGVTIYGAMVNINSGGSPGSGSGSSPESPQDPTEAQEAADDEAGQVTSASANPEQKQGESTDSEAVGSFELSAAQAQALSNAARSGAPFCEKCEEARKAREQQSSTSPNTPSPSPSPSPGSGQA
ncbi:MAG: type VI secretion system tip protein VgrG [Gammaproteobacteria bacterium]|nr:type VI secretion system tip protein VgrG [Gammaproteobacteria bacterium]MCP5425526.1 type VI secretion system tip protein VgrG [Gammaproteobacteria bacterium]MCP5459354.1 type VI secretion system tip protein VgrG [Gammaproteobacteria bacterium]